MVKRQGSVHKKTNKNISKMEQIQIQNICQQDKLKTAWHNNSISCFFHSRHTSLIRQKGGNALIHIMVQATTVIITKKSPFVLELEDDSHLKTATPAPSNQRSRYRTPDSPPLPPVATPPHDCPPLPLPSSTWYEGRDGHPHRFHPPLAG